METLIRFGVTLLEGMFVAGLIGSALVILATTVDDLEVLFEKADPEHPE